MVTTPQDVSPGNRQGRESKISNPREKGKGFPRLSKSMLPGKGKGFSRLSKSRLPGKGKGFPRLSKSGLPGKENKANREYVTEVVRRLSVDRPDRRDGDPLLTRPICDLGVGPIGSVGTQNQRKTAADGGSSNCSSNP